MATPNKIASYIEDDYNLENRFRTIDSTTTVDGLLKIIAEEHIFREDMLHGVEEFIGQIYQIISTETATKYKVRVPGVHSMLPVPSSFGDSADERSKKIIGLYPDFILQDASSNKGTFSVGNFVKVTFENIANFTGGRIIEAVSTINSGLSMLKPETPTSKEQPKATDAFKEPPTFQKGSNEYVNKKYEDNKKSNRITKEIETAVAEAASEFSIDPSLIKAIIAIESDFKPSKTNVGTGAQGLMQIRKINSDPPVIGYRYKKGFLKKFKDVPYNAYDIKQNIYMSTNLLSDYTKIYKPDTEKILGAYNYGAYQKTKDGKLIFEQPNYKELLAGNTETLSYMKNVMDMYSLFKKEASGGGT